MNIIDLFTLLVLMGLAEPCTDNNTLFFHESVVYVADHIENKSPFVCYGV